MQEGEALSYEEALKRAAALCGSREVSSSHVRSKLINWKVSEEDASRIIDRL